VLGHESLGRVVDPGPSSGLKKGDLVVGIVRRPDPVPCPNCAVGEWDMCRNGQYTERGIKQIPGYMSERWRIESEYAIKIDPTLKILGVLLEPTTVVAKAWEHTLAVGHRAFWDPRTVLVTGAGPIGLLGALLESSLGWRYTSSTGTRRDSSPSRFALWARPTIRARSQMLGLRRTSSSSAPGLAR
jgi:glucose 1-dehydrogenase